MTVHLEVDESMVAHLALAIHHYRGEVLKRDAMPTPPELAEIQEWATKASRGQVRTVPANLAHAKPMPQPPLMPLLLRQDEVADVLRVSARTVRRLTAAGKLRSVAIEGAVRYHAADVEDFAANLATRPLREAISTKAPRVGAGAAGRVGAPGTLHPGHGTEHKGAA